MNACIPSLFCSSSFLLILSSTARPSSDDVEGRVARLLDRSRLKSGRWVILDDRILLLLGTRLLLFLLDGGRLLLLLLRLRLLRRLLVLIWLLGR